MQQGGGQGPEGRHPSSPRGASGGNLPKFSLLGQQLTSYGQQNPQTTCNMGFSLGVHPQIQNHQSHSQAFAQAPTLSGSGGGGGSERSYANFLQNMSNGGPVGGPPFNQSNNQNNSPFMNQLSTGQEFSNKNLSNMNMQGSSPDAIMSALQIIQQKIGQLQAIVPFLASAPAQGVNNQAQQQQVAAASTINMISQLAAVASSMFPAAAQAPQQGPTVSNQQQSMGNNFSGPPSQLNEIIQHMGESLPPQAYNFFQQQGGSSTMGPQQGLTSMTSPAMGNPVGNNFPGMQPSGGNNLVTPLPNMGPGLVGNLSGVYGCDGGAGSASPGQNFRNKELGNVLNSQMGNGNARNTLGSAGVGRESNVMSRPPHQLVMGSPSQLDDDASRRRSRDEDDDGEGEKLDPSEYELIEMDALEILAEHTHFCEICGKGFKRDANLRMHMRGHGDEYKTPAALARPDKAAHDQAAVKERRYSCPYAGCKRNKKHRKFAPLKTMLCVKNHYRRSHCPKMLSCAKCKSKKFSVVADLKTHEKHCGCDKWQCSCGTTFSRKDKLLGHIALFAGHTPAVPLGDSDNHRELDSLDLSASNQNVVLQQQQQQQQQQSVNSSSQYNISGSSGIGGGMISELSAGMGSGIGSGGNGSGMGHAVHSMHGRLAESSNVGSETTPSTSYSQGGQGLLPQSSMLSGLFTNNFLQGSSGGSTSSDCLH